MTRLVINKIPQLNTLVIRQVEGKDFFISTEDALVINVQSLAFILKFLVFNGFISDRVLYGILEEYHSDRKGKI